jgi:phosphoribosylformylglycinamidine synthase
MARCADLPIKELGDEAPLYDALATPAPLIPADRQAPVRAPGCAAACSSGPRPVLPRWVWEQYDHLFGNTVRSRAATPPRCGSTDGPGLRSRDVTPRYVQADPFEGGKQAVAECWRNLTAVGATPLAVTDNLNFGNPERPEIMGQLVRAIQGIGEACRALDFPIVSGNVSLYNETQGEAILPTPAIGGVGLLPDWQQSAALAFRAEGDVILLIGAGPESWGSHLGQSLYLREILGREYGLPPPVDLDAEKTPRRFRSRSYP